MTKDEILAIQPGTRIQAALDDTADGSPDWFTVINRPPWFAVSGRRVLFYTAEGMFAAVPASVRVLY